MKNCPEKIAVDSFQFYPCNFHYTDLLVLSLHTREPDISLDLLHSHPKVKKYQDIRKISGGQKISGELKKYQDCITIQ